MWAVQFFQLSVFEHFLNKRLKALRNEWTQSGDSGGRGGWRRVQRGINGDEEKLKGTLEVAINTSKERGPEFCSQRQSQRLSPGHGGRGQSWGSRVQSSGFSRDRGLAPAQPTAWRDFVISQTEHSDHGNCLSGIKEQLPLEACASPERPHKGQSWILALTVGWRG